jgi:histidinol dehydrogenase
MLPRLNANAPDFVNQLSSLRKKLSPDGSVVSKHSQALTQKLFGTPLSPQQVVERICTEVREHRTEAVLKYARALDNPDATRESLRVPEGLLQRAHEQASETFLRSIRAIRENITRFQTAILHRDVDVPAPHGIQLRHRYTPLQRVGICVPGGAAAYPSTVLMTAIPALCAGVKEIAVIAPPTPFGAYNPDVLATCRELGIHEVYAVGGAQGIASLAYGIPEIPSVDKIVGPGNLFVALAKRFVYGTVDIDSIAGPSEVLVIADATTKPEFAASDLIAQAEHSPGSSVIVSTDATMLDAVDRCLAAQLKTTDRGELAEASLLEFGASIWCESEEDVIALTELLAPEHLQISVDHPERFAHRIHNAGAQFLGHYTPVALGDYAAGPSHVLPTGATARWASGLSANHFLRSFSQVKFDLDSLRGIADCVAELANKEGLTAHRESVLMRLANP